MNVSRVLERANALGRQPDPPAALVATVPSLGHHPNMLERCQDCGADLVLENPELGRIVVRHATAVELRERAR